MQGAASAHGRPVCVRQPTVPCSTTSNSLCSSINAFGLAFIAVFSCVVVILDFTILRIMVTLSRFRRVMAPKLDRWLQDGVFQLQRRAYEAQGEGLWLHTDKEIPVTVGNEQLKDLPLASKSAFELRYLHECASCSARKLRSMKSWATDTTAVEGKKRGKPILKG